LILNVIKETQIFYKKEVRNPKFTEGTVCGVHYPSEIIPQKAVLQKDGSGSIG
jgi:hypothetical protein